jgi:predicted alpha/beta superfamily hydrolase
VAPSPKNSSTNRNPWTSHGVKGGQHESSAVLRRLILSAIVVLVTAGLTTVVLFDHFTGHLPGMSPAKEGIIETKIHSAILKEDRDLIIYLPANYDSAKKYPVMYVLDGSSHEIPLLKSLEILSAGGIVPATIVVAIPNMSAKTRQRDLTPPYLRQDNEVPDSPPGDGNTFLEFMEQELFPFIEKTYAVSTTRAISGHSRGGLLVMHSLVWKPELFLARFCYSAPFWRQDGVLIAQVSDFLSKQDTLKSFLYLTVGDHETTNIQGGYEGLEKFLEEKAPVGLAWHFSRTENSNHQNNVEHAAPKAISQWGQFIRLRSSDLQGAPDDE